MVLQNVYVVGRAPRWDEAAEIQRPGSARLMHALIDDQTEVTVCGVDVGGWSRDYLTAQIAGRLGAILCMRCEAATRPRQRPRRQVAA